MMIDASAIVAVLLNEPKGDEMTRSIAAATTRFTSAIAIWEATTRLFREFGFETAQREVHDFVRAAGMMVIEIGEEEARLALAARITFGTGKYKLNMGDCFAYACAKANGVPLLFVGIDFTRTDVNDGYTL